MAMNGGDELTGVGSYSHEGTTAQYNSTGDDSKENFAPAYSFSAGAAHVKVDLETGVVDIDDFVFAHDCGRALNRRAVEGQLEGSIRKAALVHDLVRPLDHHEAQAGKILEKEGYPWIGALAASHNSEKIYPGEDLHPEEILCYADWTTDGTMRVSIRQRFEKSRRFCSTREALSHHDARYQKARMIETKIRSRIGIS